VIMRVKPRAHLSPTFSLFYLTKEGNALRQRHIVKQFACLSRYTLCCVFNRPKVCLRSEDAFDITCVANLMEVKFLYVQQDLRYEISSYWCFND
jgi:hypothetical protein